jgi:plastocyanin
MRKGMLVVALAVLGASAVILPAVAGSEASPPPTVTAVNSTGIYAEQIHSWSPSRVAVGEGGSVTFSNPTTVPHGVEWISSPAAPVCSGGIPVGTSEAASGPEWSGSCTFTAPGTYTFYCTVHKAAMSGTITVGAPAGEPPITTTMPSTPVGSSGSNGASGSGGGGTGQPGTTNGGGSPGPSGSPFAGGAAQALKLSPAQRGDVVRGSLAVSAAGAGGRLEVDVLAKAASLARTGQAARVRVGKLERSSLSVGRVRFAVPLNARAERALARHGRLELTVEIRLTPVGGSAAKIERGVALRRPSH